MMRYILSVAVVLSICLAFYWVLLRYHTYYQLNRMLLFLCIPISFLLPVIPIPPQISLTKISPSIVAMDSKSLIINGPGQLPKEAVHHTAEYWGVIVNGPGVINWIILFYWFGVMVFGVNFFLQVILLFYRAYNKPIILDGIYHIVEVDDDKSPCSFGSYIFINLENPLNLTTQFRFKLTTRSGFKLTRAFRAKLTILNFRKKRERQTGHSFCY